MKSKGAWILTLLLPLALGRMGLAAETNAPKDAPPAASEKKAAPKAAKKAKPAAQRFRGAITAVDSKTGTLSIKNDLGEKNFVAQEAAKESLERVRIGDRVKVNYTEKEGKLYASSVRRLKVKNADTTKSPKNGTKSDKEAAKKDRSEQSK